MREEIFLTKPICLETWKINFTSGDNYKNDDCTSAMSIDTGVCLG